MKLYDGKSKINWFYAGTLTPAAMKKDSKYDALFSEPCVLYDNGEDSVYSFEPLSNAMGKAGLNVEEFKTAKTAYDALLECLSVTTEPLTLEGIRARQDATDDLICAIYETIGA